MSRSRSSPMAPGLFRAAVLVGALALTSWACDDADTGDVLTVEAEGAVVARLLFDANGTEAPDAQDTPLEDWTFDLNQPAGGTVASEVTDEDGLATFTEVPVGRLVPAVPDEELGDTLSIVEGTAEPFLLAAGQTREIGTLLSLPFHTIREVRGLPSGKPLFVEGIALNAFAPGDRSLHLRSGSRYLRILSVDEGTVGVADSVRVRGRTAMDAGVPVLEGHAVYRIGPGSSVLEPVSLSTGEAAGAQGGVLDAALVRVENADIEEVVNEGDEGVVVTADDGSGPVNIRFRDFLDLDPDAVDPETDSVDFCVGILVPVRTDGEVTWELRPRSSADVNLSRS